MYSGCSGCIVSVFGVVTKAMCSNFNQQVNSGVRFLNGAPNSAR